VTNQQVQEGHGESEDVGDTQEGEEQDMMMQKRTIRERAVWVQQIFQTTH